MTIFEFEVIMNKFNRSTKPEEALNYVEFICNALITELWYPIDMAEEMGATDGRVVQVSGIGGEQDARYVAVNGSKKWVPIDSEDMSFTYGGGLKYFRFKNKPESI